MSIANLVTQMLAVGATAEQIEIAVKYMERFAESVRPVLASRYISPDLRAEVISRDGYECVYCARAVPVPHLDHVLPWSRGGATAADNLVVSCKSCNTAKKDRTPEEWRGLL